MFGPSGAASAPSAPDRSPAVDQAVHRFLERHPIPVRDPTGPHSGDPIAGKHDAHQVQGIGRRQPNDLVPVLRPPNPAQLIDRFGQRGTAHR